MTRLNLLDEAYLVVAELHPSFETDPEEEFERARPKLEVKFPSVALDELRDAFARARDLIVVANSTTDVFRGRETPSPEGLEYARSMLAEIKPGFSASTYATAVSSGLARTERFDEWSAPARQARWASIVSNSYLYPNLPLHRDSIELAREIMRRVRKNVEIIVDRLNRWGYRLAYPEWAHQPPRKEQLDQIREFEKLGFHMPLSLRIFCEEVGSVNLMGSHPGWGFSGYAFGNDATNLRETDPLVVQLLDLVKEVENWKWREQELPRYYQNNPLGTEFRYEIKPTPFEIDLSPNPCQKANCSGGASYSMLCNQPVADSLLLHEYHSVTLVGYLRIAFEWAGFPGFEGDPDPPTEFLVELKKDLLPL